MAIFHIQNMPPKIQNVCDKCSGELFQRDDDKPEAIKKRLEVYKHETAPLIDYYKEKIVDIDTEKPIPEIAEDVLAVLE